MNRNHSLEFRLTGIRFQFVQNGINERELKKIVEEEINEMGQ